MTRPTQVEVDPLTFVAWLVVVVVVFFVACYKDKGVVYEAVQKRKARLRAWWARLRAWWARHWRSDVMPVGGTIPPPMHPNCRCAPPRFMEEALAVARPRLEREVADMVAAHFSGPERVEPVPGGGFRHTYGLRNSLRSLDTLSTDAGLYRPARRRGDTSKLCALCSTHADSDMHGPSGLHAFVPIGKPFRLGFEQCLYCPAIVPAAGLERHHRGHLN